MAMEPSETVPEVTFFRPVMDLYFVFTLVVPRMTGPRYLPVESTICTVELATLLAGIFTVNFPFAPGFA